MAYIEHRKGKPKPYFVVFKDLHSGKRRSKAFKLRREASIFKESIRDEKNTFTRTDPNAKVADGFDRWLEVCRTVGRKGKPPVAQSTYEGYEAEAEILKGFVGDLKFCQLNDIKCQDIRAELLKSYSRKYAKRLFSTFKSMLYQARTDGVIAVHPALDVHIHITSKEKQKDKVVIPSMKEINYLLETIDYLISYDDSTLNGRRIRKAWARYGPMFYSMFFSGMRPTEVRGWPWHDIDFEKGGTKVTQDADNYGNIDDLKTAAAYRWLELPRHVLDMLAEWKKICPPSEHNLVFPNTKGRPENPANITNRGWYVLLQHAGEGFWSDNPGEDEVKPAYHLYTTRHIKASLEIKKNENPDTPNVTPKKLQTIMGHESITTTMDLYGHLFPDENDTNPDEILDMVKNAGKKKRRKTALKPKKKVIVPEKKIIKPPTAPSAQITAHATNNVIAFPGTAQSV